MIKLVEQLSGPHSGRCLPIARSPLPYLTAVPSGASRWLCAAGILFTACALWHGLLSEGKPTHPLETERNTQKM